MNILGKVIAGLILLLGWYFVAWLGDLFSFTISFQSYFLGCFFGFGAALLWE
jgi:hypothetical protein